MKIWKVGAGIFAALCVFVAIDASKSQKGYQNSPAAVKASETPARPPESASPAKGLTDDEAQAYHMARMWAKEKYAGRPHLDFATSTEGATVTKDGNVYSVIGVVTEDDPFQPKPKHFSWRAKVQKGRGDNWKLISVE